jgi:hypothetical protein
MILTDEQAKERLNSNRNLLNRFGKDKPVTSPSVDIIPINRPKGDTGEIPKEIRTEITARARLGEGQTALAREFGVSQQLVHRYQSGLGGKAIDEKAVEDRMNQVQDVAMCKLLSSLGFLDDDKLKKLGAKDLAAVAASMSKVVGNTREQRHEGNQVTVQLFAPEIRNEKSYKVLEVTSV